MKVKSVRKFIYILVPLCATYFATVVVWLNNRHQIQRFVKTMTHETDPEVTCPNITLSRVPLPLTVLVSFPGSGNTWTRHLLQRMTGIATGSDYFDKSLENGGFIGESKLDGSVIAVKTHYKYLPEKDKPMPGIKRAILVIRNPYEAMLSDFNHHYSKSHVGTVPLTVFMKEWPKYYSQWSRIWYSLNHSWISKMKHLGVIFYENLQSNLRRELTRLNSFFELNGPHGNVQCALRKPEGNFHRNTSDKLPLRFFYDVNQVTFMNSEIDKLKRLLSDYNYNHYNVTNYKQPIHIATVHMPKQLKKKTI